MKHRYFIKALMIVMISSIFSGCSPASTKENDSCYTIGVLLKSMNHQHWMDVRSGIEDAAGNLGVETIILYPADESASEEQKAMFYDLVSAKPDAILFAPCDSGNCAGLVQASENDGIPVIAIDTRSEDISLPYIGANNYLIGRLAAQHMIQLTGGTGSIAVVSGVKTQASHTERLSGFKQELERHPGMTIATVKNADSDFRLAMQSMEKIISEYPDISGVFCTSAVMGLGVIEQKKRGFYAADPYIVSVDTQDDALSALKNGTLDGLVTQDGYEAGFKAVYEVVALLEGEEIEENTYIHTELLTRKNIDEFMDERLSEKWGYNEKSIDRGR